MKTTHLLISLLLLTLPVHGQTNSNPFEKYGYKVKTATLTDGRFAEYHDQQTIVEIGSVLFDTKLKKVVGFSEPDTAYANLPVEVISMQPDPMAAKFYHITPYAIFLNNPIRIIDPTGMVADDYIVNIGGTLQQIIPTDSPHMLFVEGENGEKTELTFNDPENDRAQLGTFKVGEQVVQFVSDADVNGIMKQSDIQEEGIVNRYFKALEESNSSVMDFGVVYLGANPSKDMTGGFTVFGFENAQHIPTARTAYNLMDGGNFLWGHAMKRLGFNYSTARMGAQANEWFKDSPADQKAIRQGYFYNVGTKNINYNSIYKTNFKPKR